MSFFVKNKTKQVLDNRPKNLTDALAGPDYNNETDGITRGLVLDLFHVPTGESVNFKAFLTTYSDQYNSSWESTEVFGRMDPIQTFKNTKRVISLGWDVVASSVEEAIINLDKCQRLFSMLYPVYETHDDTIPGSTTMVASPLFKLKFVNLIQNVSSGAFRTKYSESGGLEGADEFDPLNEADATVKQINDIEIQLQDEYDKIQGEIADAFAFEGLTQEDEKVKELIQKLENIDNQINVSKSRAANLKRLEILDDRDNGNFTSIGNSAAKFQGLVGTVSGFTYEPDIEVGFFSDGTGGELYPQTIKLACEYTVLHTHKLGWSSVDGKKRTNAFPYKANPNK